MNKIFNLRRLTGLASLLLLGTSIISAQTESSYVYLYKNGNVIFSKLASDINYVKLEENKTKLSVYNMNNTVAFSQAVSGVDSLVTKTVNPDLWLEWATSTATGQFYANTPAMSPDGKCVYVLSNDYALRCYDSATGVEKWAFKTGEVQGVAFTPSATYSTPSVDSDGTIYIAIGNTNGKLFAVNPTGTLKWVTQADAKTGFWNKGSVATPGMRYGSPIADDKYVYCGNGGSTGSMVAFDKTTGKRVTYLTNAAGTAGPAGGILQGPVINSNGFMYMMGAVYGEFGVDKASMKTDNTFTPLAWQRPSRTDLKDYGSGLSANAQGSMAIDAEGNAVMTIYPKNSKTTIYCVKQDGSPKWITSIDNSAKQDQGGVVIGTDGTVYASLKKATGIKGGIVALDGTTGVEKWIYELDESVSGAPAIDAEGHILFGTDSGNFYIIDETGQNTLAKIDVAAQVAASNVSFASQWAAGKGKMWSSPIIDATGKIYIGITNTASTNNSCMVALQSKYVSSPAASVWPMHGRDVMQGNTVK